MDSILDPLPHESLKVNLDLKKKQNKHIYPTGRVPSLDRSRRHVPVGPLSCSQLAVSGSSVWWSWPSLVHFSSTSASCFPQTPKGHTRRQLWNSKLNYLTPSSRPRIWWAEPAVSSSHEDFIGAWPWCTSGAESKCPGLQAVLLKWEPKTLFFSLMNYSSFSLRPQCLLYFQLSFFHNSF